MTLTFEINAIKFQLPVLAMAKVPCPNDYYNEKKWNYGFKLRREIGERQRIPLNAKKNVCICSKFSV